jgi:hypothetical protein
VARTFWKDQDVAAAAEVRGDLVERVGVGRRGIVGRVDPPDDRHRARAVEQPAQAGHRPQRRLRDRRDLTRSVGDHEDRIDQRVRVIRHEHAAADVGPGSVAEALDVAKVQPHHAPKGRDERLAHAAAGARLLCERDRHPGSVPR